MGSKYKSPLIRSRNTSSAATPLTGDNVGSAAQRTDVNPNRNVAALNDILVYDNTPQRASPVRPNWRGGRGGNFGSPRSDGPRSRGSPYQWSSPNRMANSSWSSDQNNSGNFVSPHGQNSSYSSPYRPQFNKYKKQNFNNHSNRYSSDNSDENYFHPSMLEDPWACLLNSSENNTE